MRGSYSLLQRRTWTQRGPVVCRKLHNWQELVLSGMLPCSQMEECPRGPVQLWDDSQKDRPGGRDEDIEQGGLPRCKGRAAGWSLDSTEKLLRGKNKGNPEPGLLSGNQQKTS